MANETPTNKPKPGPAPVASAPAPAKPVQPAQPAQPTPQRSADARGPNPPRAAKPTPKSARQQAKEDLIRESQENNIPLTLCVVNPGQTLTQSGHPYREGEEILIPTRILHEFRWQVSVKNAQTGALSKAKAPNANASDRAHERVSIYKEQEKELKRQLMEVEKLRKQAEKEARGEDDGGTETPDTPEPPAPAPETPGDTTPPVQPPVDPPVEPPVGPTDPPPPDQPPVEVEPGDSGGGGQEEESGSGGGGEEEASPTSPTSPTSPGGASAVGADDETPRQSATRFESRRA